RILENTIAYDAYTVGINEQIQAIANKFGMHPDFLMAINGLLPGDKVSAGDVLAVMDKAGVRQPAGTHAYKVMPGLYEVRDTASVGYLAKQCGVTDDEFREANSAIPPGGEVRTGDLVYLLHHIDAPPPVAIAPTVVPKAGKFADVKELPRHLPRTLN